MDSLWVVAILKSVTHGNKVPFHAKFVADGLQELSHKWTIHKICFQWNGLIITRFEWCSFFHWSTKIMHLVLTSLKLWILLRQTWRLVLVSVALYTDVEYPKVWDLCSGLGGGGSRGTRCWKLSTSGRGSEVVSGSIWQNTERKVQYSKSDISFFKIYNSVWSIFNAYVVQKWGATYKNEVYFLHLEKSRISEFCR